MTYGTPGTGTEFVGTKKSEISQAGQIVVELFDKFIRSR